MRAGCLLVARCGRAARDAVRPRRRPRCGGATAGVSVPPTGRDARRGAPGPAPDPTAPLDLTLLPDRAEVLPSGRLAVAGVDLGLLAQAVGTPCYVYDEATLRARCEEAHRAFPGGAAYASKAFSCIAMDRLASGLGLAIDVASLGELRVALAADVPPAGMVLHGNNKSLAELELALATGVGRIVVDSLDEVTRLERLVFAGGFAPPAVWLRVTPGVDPKTHAAIATGQLGSKFGLPIAGGGAAAALDRLARSPAVRLVGVHSHIGSQVTDLLPFQTAARRVAELAVERRLAEVCLGGGLGAAYVAGDAVPSLSDWAAAVERGCREAGLPPDMHPSAEPGRALVARAGLTLYTVGTVKRLPQGPVFVAVDGGMGDNPRPALYGSRYEAFLPRAPLARRPLAAAVVGHHCESGDVLVAEGRLPADVAVGDCLAVAVTGAYGHAMASTYNRVPRPPVIFLSGGDARVVVRRETVEDVLRLETEAPVRAGPLR